MRTLNHIRKFIILLGVAVIISIFSFTNLRAQGTAEGYLAVIAQNTTNILQKVNDLPTYLQNAGQLILSWITPDNSPTTISMQESFATLGKLFVDDFNKQNSMQGQLSTDLLGPNTTTATLPNANDLVYSTLLGSPYFPKDPRNPPGGAPKTDPPYNYIKNAGGINISHVRPGLNWQGKPQDQIKYSNYYATVMSIASFNGYVLSNLYADYQNSQDSNSLGSIQSSLITQASGSNWIAQIATEELGKVLRQILMFQSQSYVLLSQLVQTEKQILAAHAMTNALLIASNQNNESYIASKAQGIQPSP